MQSFHDKDVQSSIKILDSSQKGLGQKQAEKRIEIYGYNELKKEKKGQAILIFLSQFKNFLIILLLVASIISYLLHEALEAIAILAIVLLSAILGFLQEFKAEKAMEALQKISAPIATVRRDGKVKKIAAKELVPGDIILLESGDIVPADCRIIMEESLQIDEASLTGESVPSPKETGKMAASTSVADQENMAFMGTVVTYGKGEAIVVATAQSTQFGKIADSIQQTKESQTPLQKKFEQMARQISIIVGILVAVVFAAGIMTGEAAVAMFIFALSLAVAAVPSSLPAIVTISLANGAKALSDKKMIIKKLPAAESLGAVTYICTDKTGTITKNEMTVTKIYSDGAVANVSGTGYNPQGNINGKISAKNVELILKTSRMCNNAKLNFEEGKYKIIGDPTEGALIVLADKGKLKNENQTFVKELPFDSDRKLMSVVYRNKNTTAYVKGAPDLLLKKCTKILKGGKEVKITKTDIAEINRHMELFANDALRVLGLAYKTLNTKKYDNASVENALTFVGLVGMIDPAREEVKDSIKQCRDAGIKIMVITGDHAITSAAIARKIGLLEKNDKVMTGEEIEKLSDEKLDKIIEEVRIISRALPTQKSRIVEILKKKGHVVAMTGDGVNDAPALKKADIGIAMGITGTDVAKEVSKGVLADDNFATIVNAISEGRNIYDKIIKSTRYLLSCNMGEIVTIFIAILLRFPLPLTTLQILLMNLVTDGLPALALGAEKAEKDVMKRSPRNPKENPLNKGSIIMILAFGLIMGLGSLFVFNLYSDVNHARTAAFTTLVMFEMFAVLGSRSLSPFSKISPFSNKWLLAGVSTSIIIQLLVIYWAPLSHVFETVPLAMMDWVYILAVSSTGFLIMESSKFFAKNNH